MVWLVENLLNAESFNVIKMVEALEQNGVDYKLVNTVPFEHVYLDYVEDVDPTFVYGSTVTLKAATKIGHGNLIRIAPKESELLDNIGDLYMNSDMVSLPFEESTEYIESSNQEFFFVKPDTDLKSFDGTITDKERYKFFIENSMTTNNYDKTTKICISSVKIIEKEWRVFVVGNQISTYSQYRQNRKLFKSNSIDDGAYDLARKCIDIYPYSDMMVIDVALMDDSSYKVIEYNTINCSGLYDSDVKKLVSDINSHIRGLK